MADMTAAIARGREVAPSQELLARFGAAAEAEGLLDVAYTTYDAPFGPLVLGGTPEGLVRLAFDPVDVVVEDLSERVSPRVLASPGRFDRVRRQLDEYFAGSRQRFDIPIDLQLAGTAFRRAVLAAAEAIPYGQVRSYGEVARSAGNPAAVRAVGSALGANPVCVVVPCHRVLRSDGSISGYAGGPERKDFLLRLEGAR
jgi:methylated-DNA-[protein]-cysteine S-methyltransferase